MDTGVLRRVSLASRTAPTAGRAAMAPEHEIRLALVMNGGVSLAVWMGGVTHELDLIRRATTENTPAPQAYDLPVADRWHALMQGPDVPDRRRLVIDVVAGTSAG